MGNPFTSQPNNQQLLQFKTNQFQQRNLLFSSSSCWPFTKSLPVPKGSASLSTPLISLAHLEVLLDSVMVTLIFLASGTGLGVANSQNGGFSSGNGQGFGSGNLFGGFQAGGNGQGQSFGK